MTKTERKKKNKESFLRFKEMYDLLGDRLILGRHFRYRLLDEYYSYLTYDKVCKMMKYFIERFSQEYKTYIHYICEKTLCMDILYGEDVIDLYYLDKNEVIQDKIIFKKGEQNESKTRTTANE